MIFAPLTAVGAAAVPPVTLISASSKPVTASLKVKVAVKALPLWNEGAPIVTVGAVLSTMTVTAAVTVTASAAILALPALSVATPASTLSTTLVLSSMGVMVAVKRFPDPVDGFRAEVEPPLMPMSARAKPVTASLKVKVAVKALPLWDEGAPIVTVGAVLSAVTVSAAAATLLLPAASWAAAAATFSTTLVLLALGVMVAVKRLAALVVAGLKAEALPPVTSMSARAKPLTISSKTKLAVKALPLWDEGASIVTVGAVVSVTVAAVLATLSASSDIESPLFLTTLRV